MKVNYINEGYFKNPEQMKAAAEKRNEISAAEKLAKRANDILVGPCKEYLENMLNSIANNRKSFDKDSTFSKNSFKDRLKRDFLHITPEFISEHGMIEYLDVYDSVVYEYERCEVDIDYRNKCVFINVILGPLNIVGSNNTEYAILRKNSSGKRKVYFSYADCIYNAIFDRDGYTGTRCIRNNNEKNLADSIINELTCARKEANSTDLIRILDFLISCEYKLNIKWNLVEDIVLIPFFEFLSDMIDGSGTTWGWRGPSTGRLYNINKYIYPYKDDLEKLDWNKFSKGDKDRLQWSANVSLHSFEDLAKEYASILNNMHINVTGGHLYLSTGYYDKDYLIV